MAWNNEEKIVARFWASAGRLGFDQPAVLEILQIKSIEDLACTMGQALSRLQKASEGKAASTSSALVALSPNQVRALYPTDELHQFALAVRQFAPWANNEEYPVTNRDIALIVRRGDALGVDVLNPHEVQVWKDKRGNINFQLAYTLMAQWAQQILGGHTAPQYRPLTDEEKEQQGIAKGDKACACTFIMLARIPIVKQLMDAGFEPAEARAAVTVKGIGLASAAEYAGEYFAPATRSKIWKVQKRAYIDALRRMSGTPSRAAIAQMRRARGENIIEPSDWSKADGSPQLAQYEAKARIRARDVIEGNLAVTADQAQDELFGDYSDNYAPETKVARTWADVWENAVEELGYKGEEHVEAVLEARTVGEETPDEAWAILADRNPVKRLALLAEHKAMLGDDIDGAPEVNDGMGVSELTECVQILAALIAAKEKESNNEKTSDSNSAHPES